MRIESVQIEAFGPFANSKLEFAPGFTVVHGPNESGKSTWHAATYAALCGMRRARGRHGDDQKFADRHHPWDANRWLVVAVVTLQDGRRIELRQNLEDKVDCSATDLVLGGDVSAEIIGEGSPDASVWLGMNRHTFLATGCIRQADVLSIRESADALQEHLQRAASTAGVDATAARALELLEAFQRENVGRDIANSTKPLRRALERLRLARIALMVAQEEHAQFLARSQLADKRIEEAGDASRARCVFEAALATKRADDVQREFARASQLSEQYFGKAAPDLSSDDLLAQRAAAALQAFESRPPLAAFDGETVDQLTSQLAQLPLAPEGDTKPDDGVVRAKAAWDGVARALTVHDAQRPAEASVPTTTEPAESLRQLALALQREEQTFASEPRGSLRPVGWTVSILGVIAAIGGLAEALVGNLFVGIAAAVIGIAAAVAGAYLVLRRRRLPAKTSPEVDSEYRGPVSKRLAELELPPDPGQLLTLADRVEGVERQRALILNWDRGRHELTEQWGMVAQNLSHELEVRHVSFDGDLGGAYEQYLAECASRTQQAALAKRRTDIEAQLEQRRIIESGATEAENRRAIAEEKLRAVSVACGISDGTNEAVVQGLEKWLRQRSEQQVANSTELAERAELQSLLGAGTLDDLGALVGRLRTDSDQLAAPFDLEALSGVELGANPESHLRVLQQAESEAAGAAQRARGEIEELKARLHEVAPAEEEVAAADSAVAELRELDQTLQTTRQYLEAAQERVHRDIAPLLANMLSSWLPRVTNGRYEQAIVNPETLAVQIRGEGGKWRDAGLVSDGTREQVYLLLRMALAQRLTKKGEVSPLLFDEVTVQSDAHRTVSTLELLHEMSTAGQVILFSQEGEVRTWAEENLTEPKDRLQLLDAGAVRA